MNLLLILGVYSLKPELSPTPYRQLLHIKQLVTGAKENGAFISPESPCFPMT